MENHQTTMAKLTPAQAQAAQAKADRRAAATERRQAEIAKYDARVKAMYAMWHFTNWHIVWSKALQMWYYKTNNRFLIL